MDIYLEGFADFMAKMIQKYADEMKKEMEEVDKTIENNDLAKESEH